MTALVNKERLVDQYDFLVVLQNFLHFFFRNLSYTNPVDLIEHSFLNDLGLYCAKLVMVRPISTTEYILGGDWDLDRPCLAPKETWDVYYRLQSVAQLGVDVNTNVQMVLHLYKPWTKLPKHLEKRLTACIQLLALPWMELGKNLRVIYLFVITCIDWVLAVCLLKTCL
jgi:hypothetical protein